MSTINAEQIHSTVGNRTVTVPEIYDKIHETAPVLTSITSPTGKTVTIDELYTKAKEGSIPTQVKLTSFTAVVGESYRVVNPNVVVTLPLGSTVTKGAPIKIAKLNGITTVIAASGADMITIGTRTGESILMDLPIEVIVVWNGTGWEI